MLCYIWEGLEKSHRNFNWSKCWFWSKRLLKLTYGRKTISNNHMLVHRKSLSRIFSPLLARKSSGFAQVLLAFFCLKIAIWKVRGGGGCSPLALQPRTPMLNKDKCSYCAFYMFYQQNITSLTCSSSSWEAEVKQPRSRWWWPRGTRTMTMIAVESLFLPGGGVGSEKGKEIIKSHQTKSVWNATWSTMVYCPFRRKHNWF